MKQTTSRDGTTLAFDQTGQGLPVVLVLGAFNDRKTGGPLAAFLAPHFRVLSYDRRGRGDSGDASSYAIEREVEDLEAIIRAAGGSASVFGYSSGAALALQACAHGAPITRLALFELPPPIPAHHTAELAALVAAGRRGDAVEYFQRRIVGIPEDVIAQLRHAPFRRELERMAHTLVYDATLVNERLREPELIARVRQATLAIAGGASPPMREMAESVARRLPSGELMILEGATHDIVPPLLGPALVRFLSSSPGRS